MEARWRSHPLQLRVGVMGAGCGVFPTRGSAPWARRKRVRSMSRRTGSALCIYKQSIFQGILMYILMNNIINTYKYIYI
jgi:hypothetical protein